MRFIEDRNDVSEWLIHFTRGSNPNDTPKEWEEPFERSTDGFGNILSILRIGGLIPGYSFRGGKTTIYGDRPVVCFTEAPIMDFIRYVKKRNDTTRNTFYGICLLKSEVFNAGGRPVIYGLSGENIPSLIESTETKRLIDPDCLPIKEQYRFVAYDPTRTKPLDWTHEREWRWAVNPKRLRELSFERAYDTYIQDIACLPLFEPRELGGCFSKVGFLVSTRDEATRIAEQILNYADSGGNDFVEYDRSILQNSFVIPVSEVEQTQSQRIEDLSEQMKIIAFRTTATEEQIDKVAKVVLEASRLARETADAYYARHADPGFGHIKDSCGFAWVVTYETTSAITDALLKKSLARPSADGKGYVVECLTGVNHNQSVSYNEAAALAAAELLTKNLGQKFYMNSRLD